MQVLILSPDMILQSIFDCFKLYMTYLESFLGGFSNIKSPRKSKSFSICSLVSYL